MRLTLRTLLAYMDDILDPADQEELGRKIESSPFATELIHRSRDAVRRARLSAPEPLAGADDDIHGSDANLDANTVSEYLDNVLPPEAVAEFERGCLEAGPNSDMLLAEAASCHHILTMVLGEPAEVDGDLRQRMYALSQSPAASQQMRVDTASLEAPQSSPPQQSPVAAPPLTTSVTVASPITTRSRSIDVDEREVPDYIRAAARERRRNRMMSFAFAAAMLLGGAATWYFWPQKPVSDPGEVAALGGSDKLTQAPVVAPIEAADDSAAGETADAASDVADPNSTAPAFVPSAGATGAAPTTAPPAVETAPPLPPEGSADAPMAANGAANAGVETASNDAIEATAAAAAAVPGSTALTPGSEIGSTAPDSGNDAGAIPPAPTDEQVEAAAGSSGDALMVAEGAATASSDLTTSAAATSPSPPQLPPGPEMTGDATEGATESPTPGPNLITGGPGEAAVDGDAAVADAGARATGQVKPIGHYLGANDMLLRSDSEGAWLRMPPRSPVVAGEKLLALPAFRTLVVLADMNVYLTGGAEIELASPGGAGLDAPVDVALHVPFGQVILNSGLNGNRVQLLLIDQERVIQLGPSSSMAMHVKRVFQPGAAAQRTPAPAEVTWRLTSGTATRGDGVEVQAPAMWTTLAGEDSTPEAIDELPAWVDRDPLSTLERTARDRVAEALLANEPVNIKLLELSDKTGLGRRVEVRMLAARSGTYVGVFDPVVRALGDVDQRAYWKAHIETLRDALARDPKAAEGIHAAFAIGRGERPADDLMEMLLGFDQAAIGTTRGEVQNGVLLRLLRWMEHDDLVYRVLAQYNVNQITGTNLGGYRPEQTAQQRERAMRFYWQAMESGDLIRKP